MNAYSSGGMSPPVIIINNVPVPPIEVNGERVVALPMIDKVHGRPDGTAGRNFRENRQRFSAGRHFHEITQPDEIRRLGFERPQGGVPAKVILVTERGYLMLTKSLNDDLAWTVQEQLVDSYFEKPKSSPSVIDMRDISQLRLATIQLIEMNSEKDDRIAQLEPKAHALDLLESSEGSVGPRLAAKMLNMAERKFITWMQANRWAFRQNGIGPLQAYLDKRERGYLEHRPHTYHDQVRGEERTVPQLMITPKGLKRLAELLSGGTA